MLPQLISRSPDLLQLWEEGLSLDGYMLVHDVPYVNSNGAITYGTLLSAYYLIKKIHYEDLVKG